MTRDNPVEVELCMGSACFARGNKTTVDELNSFITENELEVQVTLKGCLCSGSCKHGPLVSINGCKCNHVKSQDVIDRVKKLTKGSRLQ